MIIQALVRYYEAKRARGEIEDFGWCQERVSYALNLSASGELLDIIPLLLEETRGKKTVNVPQMMGVPTRYVRSAGVRANFLCDNSSYLLGVDKKGKPERAYECFEACHQLHQDILGDTPCEAATAICAFFDQWSPANALNHPVLADRIDEIATANLVFMVNGTYAHEDADLRKNWSAYYEHSSSEQPRLCMVSGEMDNPVELHGKIKGAGGQSSGTNLVSFNASAFESYGMEGNANAPMGKHTAFAYTTALNHLLSSHTNHQSLGEDVIVYWAENADPQIEKSFSIMNAPQQDDAATLAAMMDRLAAGEPVAEGVDMNTQFYVLCLSPNAARLSVRFFLQDSFGHMLANNMAHYQRLQLVHAPYETDYLSTYLLLREITNLKSRNKQPDKPIAGAVVRSILTGELYPQSLYSSVLMRVRSEQDSEDKRTKKITYGRAAIIKAFLLHNTDLTEEDVTVALNESNNNRAYVLGRVFSLLENLQETANPGINATIKDKYFTSACTTPASVFPTLIRLSEAHSAKLDSEGLKVHFQKAIGQLMNKLPGDESAIPPQLDLKEQGMFILGYYHQTQDRYKKKEAQ